MVESAQIMNVNIEDEMKSSYLDYAMSVIIGRALPDVRDGLKPAHRRVLYAMYSEGLLSSKRYSKCAGVVGEVLKKYHPHGDASVYDTLVRMAQDWNMRYPLIDGQGNFGCFTGDTKIRLADGTARSFVELVEDHAKNKKHFTYTIKTDGKIAMGEIRAPRLTKKDAEIVRVTLDHGEEIRCTPDHRFMRRDGTYCEAQNLKQGDSLMPFYNRFYEGADPNLQGYEEVYDPSNNDWVFAHHLADECSCPIYGARNFVAQVFRPASISRTEVLRYVTSPINRATTISQNFLNHTVVSVEPAGRADVYDLTVDGTHNFALANGVFVHNSIDGDSAAAYRYTEARLAKLAEELLADIDKETVDFVPNFDGSTTEPVVLPSRTPNLLVNGSDGIAVGMATKIPPHNLSEVCDALLALIKNPELTINDLMKFIPGPDFPTGAFIHGRDGIKSAYETGRGIIRTRARAAIEPISRGDREAIVITEIPFQVNKARLVERIAELVRDGKIEGISDLRDESDRDGMRIVVELKKGTVSGVILNQLYKHTSMQETFGVIMLAIVNGQPKVLPLKEYLGLFIDHRKEVVTRRTAYELKKAEERAHILAGLKIAVENIDEVIALIKRSKSPEEARIGLIKKFELSELQAQAVLEMRLQRLTGLERDKIVADYKEMVELIKKLKEILSSEKLIMAIISGEIAEIKEKYGDKRRTEIQAKTDDLTVEDLIQEEDMVVTVSRLGYIKRSPISIYRAQRRGGRGKQGMTTGDEDFVSDLFIASTHNYVMIFTQTGKCLWLKVHEIPQIGRTAKGRAITNLVQMASDDKIAAIVVVRKFEEGKFVVLATKKGLLKKTDLMEYSNPRASGIVATKIEDGDAVVSVRLISGKEDVFITTKEGQSIRFKEDEVRATGRATYGVWGITLDKKDEVVAMEVLTNETPILTVTANGYGKRSPLDEYRLQGRGGSGIITIKTTDRNGPVVGAMQVADTDDIMLVTDKGKVIRSHAKDVAVIGRNTQGVRLISLETGEHVIAVAKLAEKEEDEAVEGIAAATEEAGA